MTDEQDNDEAQEELYRRPGMGSVFPDNGIGDFIDATSHGTSVTVPTPRQAR